MGEVRDPFEGDRPVSVLDHALKSDVTTRQLEVITRTGLCRNSPRMKARIFEETLAPGSVVYDIARRHGLTPQQVFTSRRQACQPPASLFSRRPGRFGILTGSLN
jgi:transposase